LLVINKNTLKSYSMMEI